MYLAPSAAITRDFASFEDLGSIAFSTAIAVRGRDVGLLLVWASCTHRALRGSPAILSRAPSVPVEPTGFTGPSAATVHGSQLCG